jgi:hypothetical protein
MSETAYSKIRDGGIGELWMPTDLVSENVRLVSAITKIQSKEYLKKQSYAFHNNTLSLPNLCQEDRAKNLWIDYIFFSSDEHLPEDCKLSVEDFAGFQLVKTNDNPGVYILNLIGLTTGVTICSTNLSANEMAIKLSLNNCKIHDWETYTFELPIENSSDLKIYSKSIRVLSNKGVDFLTLSIKGELLKDPLIFSYSPSNIEKLRAMLIMNIQILFFFLMLRILFFHKLRRRIF